MKNWNNKEELVRFDLEWYYCRSDADCNIKSNYMAMVNVAIFGGASGYVDPYNTFILKSTHHKRDLEKTLAYLPYYINKLLYASFADIHFSPLVEKIFTKFTGAAYCSNRLKDNDKLEKLCENLHNGTASAKDKLLISEIRTEATSKYYIAIDQYIEAKIKYKLENKKNVKH